MNNYYYCYSKRLSHFIRAFEIPYITVRVHATTHIKYYVFQKSEKLDRVIALYNEVKHSCN